MQALRPVLRCRCRSRRLPLLQPRPLLQPQPLLSQPLCPLSVGRRSSSGFPPPHKEYFQTPGQCPLPDTTPYNPNEPIQTFPVAERSWLARGFRSVLWAVLFGTVGIATGAGLITWEYLQPQFEHGSPEEAEIFEEIVDTLNDHPVAEDLRGEGWIEEEFYTHIPRRSFPGSSISDGGANLIHENLTGPRGLVIKTFRHPTLNYTILLFFTGFAIEGWPDTVHGGAIASVMMEGAQRHVNNFYRNRILPDISLHEHAEQWSFNIDYKKPLRPGEVYTIVLPPGGFGTPIDGSTTKPSFRFVALAMLLDTAPRVGSKYDPLTGVTAHTLEIPSPSGVDVPHIIGSIEVHVGPEAAQRAREEPAVPDSEPENEQG